MEIKVSWPIILALLIVPLLGFWVLYLNLTQGPSNDTALLLEKLNTLKEEKVLLKNKKQSLEKVLSSIDEENKNLLSQIALLKSRKETIKYVDVVKYETKEIVVEKEVLPPNFLFRTEEGMPICSFEYKNNYLFKVIPIQYELDMVKSEKSTSVTLRAKPKTEDKYYDIPIKINESKSIEIKKYPAIEPNISVGIALTYGESLEVSPTIQVPTIHLNENLDLLTPKVTFNNSVSLGVDIVNYNIGSKVPVITDTWLGIGPSFSLNQRYLEVTLTSKF